MGAQRMYCCGTFDMWVDVEGIWKSYLDGVYAESVPKERSGISDAVTVEITQVQLLCIPRRLLNTAKGDWAGAQAFRAL